VAEIALQVRVRVQGGPAESQNRPGGKSGPKKLHGKREDRVHSSGDTARAQRQNGGSRCRGERRTKCAGGEKKCVAPKKAKNDRFPK